MEIRQNVELKGLNSFGLAAKAAWFCRASSEENLKEALEFAKQKELPIFVLGGGTNIVLVDDLDCLVIKMELMGQAIDQEQVVVAAGEPWHPFVSRMLELGLHGLENLALIPGCVGAAPIQNIGAYGVEIQDCLESVRAVNTMTFESTVFSREDCQFGYRDSLFKHTDDWVITEVILNLSRAPELKTHYPGVEHWIEVNGRSLSPASVFDAVVTLRTQKLPDPSITPNVGSFFKNPIVKSDLAESLLKTHPDLPNYPEGQAMTKLSAAWLIDSLGLKGHSKGGMQVSEQHALVLTNAGHGSSNDLLELVSELQRLVEESYGVLLEVEPQLVPSS